MGAEWMFEDQPDGTLARDGQVLHTAVARTFAALGWTRFRRAVIRGLRKVAR